MGRKPNPVVQEYFHRGQKLSDTSNRYVHTCKRCGVIFPKGRVDGLMGHLLRRCPSITQEDRHLIHDAIQKQNPDLHPIHDRHADAKSRQLLQEQQHQTHHRDRHHHSQQQQQQQQQQYAFPLQHDDVSLPLLLQGEQSALDTLAEVSGRHLDYSSYRNDSSSDPVTIPGENEEQALLAHLQGNAPVPFLPSSGTRSARMRGHIPHDSRSQHYLEPAATTTHIHSSPLIQAATAANQQLEEAAQTESRDVLDPALKADIGAQLGAERDENTSDNMLWNPESTPDTDSFAALTGTMPSIEPVFDRHTLREKSKHKRRGQFSDSRRKEVQEIRKRGACIRCRMLKKPCSEGTPCSTCKNVESARLWKSSCIRTRLADAFTLWSSALFQAKVRVEIPAFVHALTQNFLLPGRLQVQLLHQSHLCMTFAVRRYAKSSPPVVAEDAPQNLEDARSESDTGILLLLEEGEGVTGKVAEYVNEMVAVCIAAEPSLFLRRTLENAQMLIESEALEAGVTSPSTSRSCYNLHSQRLLRNVVELWVETTILAKRKQLDIRLHYNTIEQHGERPGLAFATETAGENGGVSDHNKALIVAQLLAAIESRCFSLSKNVMNEIERRLLQRQQVSRFSTFISAVILLNCIERMTGAYRSHDETSSTSIHPPEPSGETGPFHDQPLTPSEPIHATADWPFPDPPRKFWSQGERFAELLVMLLRMRALPPRTTITADGKLAVNQEQLSQQSTTTAAAAAAAAAAIKRRSTNEQSEEQMAMSATWLDPMLLNVEDLVAKRDGAFPEHDQEDYIGAWDLKFISNVLLPEGYMARERTGAS